MPSGEWIRDLVFYLIATVYILVIGFIGEITFTSSLIFMGIYIFYFGIVLCVLLVV